MRKIIVFIVALFTTIAAVLQSQLGITIGLSAALVSLVALVTYIFGEAKNDVKRVLGSITQQGKWADPTFWAALLAGILPVVNGTFSLGLSPQVIETICGVVAIILGFVFTKRQKVL